MRKILGFILVLTIFSACAKKPPRYAIPEEILLPILVDFHLTYALQQGPDFRQLAREYDSLDVISYIFEKHGYTKADFDTTISWYLENTDFFVDIYQDVIMMLTQINDSIDTDDKVL